MECFNDWRIYLRLALPGFFMMVLEWAVWEIGIIVSYLFISEKFIIFFLKAILASSRLGTIKLNIMAICMQIGFTFYYVYLENIHQ